PALLGHESGALQHGHVLLHRGEAHRVLAGQGRDRVLVLLAQRAPDDVPSRGVGEGVEQLIVVGLIYNHTVAYYPRTSASARADSDGSKGKGLISGNFAEPSDGLEPSTPSLPWRLTCSSAGWRFALPALFFVDLCGLRPSSMGYLSRPSGPEAPGTCPQN